MPRTGAANRAVCQWNVTRRHSVMSAVELNRIALSFDVSCAFAVGRFCVMVKGRSADARFWNPLAEGHQRLSAADVLISLGPSCFDSRMAPP